MKTRSNDCDLACIHFGIIVHSTKDDIGIFADDFLYMACSIVCIHQRDITADVDNNIGCTLYGRLKQRALNSLLNCCHSLVVTLVLAYTDMSDAAVCHNSLNISEVQVDQSRLIDQVCNTLNCLLKNFIRLLQSLRHSCSAINDLEKLIIRNDDQCVNILLQFINTAEGIGHTLLCLKTERLCNNTYCQASEFLCDSRNDRCTACACAATHTACYEDHICSAENLLDFLSTLVCGLLTNFRLCSCAETLGDLFTDLNNCRSFAEIKCLLIRIYSYKLDASNGFIDHAVYSVVACTPNAYNYNSRCRFSFI